MATGGKNFELALRIRADLGRASEEMQRLSGELDAARASAEGLNSAGGGASNSVSQLGNAADDAAAKLGRTRDGVKGIDKQLASAQANVLRFAGAWASFSGALRLGDLVDDYGQMAIRIRQATESAQEYEYVQGRLLTLANNTYRPLAEAQEVYIRTSESLKDLGYNSARAMNVQESLNYMFVTNAASADKANASIEAFTMSLMRGEIGSRQWMTMLRATPTLADAIARATGKSREEIKRLGAEGALAIEDLTEGLRQARDEQERLAADMPVTRRDAATALRNMTQVLLSENSRIKGVVDAVTAGIKLMAENIDIVAGGAFTVLTSATAAYTVKAALAVKTMAAQALAARAAAVAALQKAQAESASAAAALANAQAENAAAVAALAHARANASLLGTQAAVTAAEVRATAATTALAAAQTRAAVAAKTLQAAQGAALVGARGLMALLGGPAGIAAMAAMAATSFWLFRDAAQETAKELIDLQEPLEQTLEKFRAMTDQKQSQVIANLQLKIEVEEGELETAILDLMGAMNQELHSIFAAPTAEARQAFEEIAKAADDARRGISADWDALSAKLQAAPGIGAGDRARWQNLIDSIVESGRAIDDMRGRMSALTAETDAAARAADGLNAALNRPVNFSEDLIKKITDLNLKAADTLDKSIEGQIRRRVEPGTPEDQIQYLINVAKYTDGVTKADEARTKAARDAEAASKRSADAAKREAEAKQKYVEQLEKQAAQLGMTSAEVRRAELAEKGLTGALHARAQAALAAVDADEQRRQALENAQANSGLQAQLLRAQGQEAQAAMLEITTRYAQMAREMAKVGNAAGIELIRELIPVEQARARLDALRAEIDKAFSGKDRAEQSIQAQIDAGLITELEGRKRLVALHRQTAELVERYLPQLREMAKLPGPMGEQARAMLESIEAQLVLLRSTADALTNALRNGLQSGIAESLKGLADGTYNLRDAVIALVDTVIDKLAEVAASDIADWATTGLMSSFGLTGAAAPDAGMAAASTANAAAVGEATVATAGFTAAVNQAAIAAQTLASNAAAGNIGAVNLAGTGEAADAAAATAATNLGTSLTNAAGVATSAFIPALGQAAPAIQAFIAALTTSSTSSGAGGLLGGIGSIFGFARGGYTGAGAKHDPAGIVHAGEYVLRREVVRQPGMMSLLQALNRYGRKGLRLPGYADGGLVAPAAAGLTVSAMQPVSVGGSTVDNKININLIDDKQRMLDMLSTREGADAVELMLSRNPARFRRVINA